MVVKAGMHSCSRSTTTTRPSSYRGYRAIGTIAVMLTHCNLGPHAEALVADYLWCRSPPRPLMPCQVQMDASLLCEFHFRAVFKFCRSVRNLHISAVLPLCHVWS